MVEHLFPTLISSVAVPLNEQEHRTFVEKSLSLAETLPKTTDWRCDTFSTLNKYDMVNDSLFTGLIEKIKHEVLNFSKEYGVESTVVECTDAWINVANPGAFQEYHIHTGSHFSVAFYLKTPDGCGNIVFRSFEADTDMFPLPVKTMKYPSFKTWSIKPQEGMLVIFRSNVQHMVEKNCSTDKRISISMNFILR